MTVELISVSVYSFLKEAGQMGKQTKCDFFLTRKTGDKGSLAKLLNFPWPRQLKGYVSVNKLLSLSVPQGPRT